MKDNSYIPHKEKRDSTEFLSPTDLSESKIKVASLCVAELSRLAEKHQPAIADYVTKTLNSKIMATTD